VNTEPLGGWELKDRLGSLGWVVDRVEDVFLPESATDANLVHIEKLKRLVFIQLANTKITDAGLVHLRWNALLMTLKQDRSG
jgi:hypothetical protein